MVENYVLVAIKTRIFEFEKKYSQKFILVLAKTQNHFRPGLSLYATCYAWLTYFLFKMKTGQCWGQVPCFLPLFLTEIQAYSRRTYKNLWLSLQNLILPRFNSIKHEFNSVKQECKSRSTGYEKVYYFYKNIFIFFTYIDSKHYKLLIAVECIHVQLLQ